MKTAQLKKISIKLVAIRNF